MLSAISRAKDEVVGPEEYLALAEAMREKATTPEQVLAAEKAPKLDGSMPAYERLKLDARCVDFGDLVAHSGATTGAEFGIRAHFQTLYDHLLVDEYQDVNPAACVRLLTALGGMGRISGRLGTLSSRSTVSVAPLRSIWRASGRQTSLAGARPTAAELSFCRRSG